jgi:transcriptional regulator with XRE-family HTH domain
MLEALTLWLGHQRERAAIGLSQPDMYDALAKDLGISANELSYLVNAAPDPLQLPEMLKALGIDEAALRRARPALLRASRR